MIHNSKKILLVGGGTGGHITPLIAVVEELLAQGVPSSSIFLVTDPESAKMDYIQGHRIEVHTITSGKFNRFFSMSNLITPFKVFWGFWRSIKLLRKIRPEVILAKGAYLSAPLVIAAYKLHIPIYLHESDSVMGEANRRLAKYAQKIFVSFPVEYYDPELKGKLVRSGLPIRKRFFSFSVIPAKAGIQELDSCLRRNDSRKSILVWGGSQGAERLNQLILENLKSYLSRYELYHICGPEKFDLCDKVKNELDDEELKNRYHLYGFLGREIEKIIAGCDLVISRAGATSLFELAAMGKAVICVPYPYAAANHQYKNAEYFEKKNAVVLLEEKDLNGEGLKNEIFSLLDNNIQRNDLRKNILNLAPKDAAKIITEEILKLT